MPTYDVTFNVEYKRTIRVHAPDEDTAAESAGEVLFHELPSGTEEGCTLYGIVEL